MRYFKYPLLLLFISSCASTSTITNEQIAQKSVAHLGNDFIVYYVPSNGAISDATFISMSKSSGESAMAKEIAALMLKAENETVRISIGGPNNAKTTIVVDNAIDMVNKKKLPGLHIVVVGNSSASEELRKKVESIDGKIYFESIE